MKTPLSQKTDHAKQARSFMKGSENMSFILGLILIATVSFILIIGISYINISTGLREMDENFNKIMKRTRHGR